MAVILLGGCELDRGPLTKSAPPKPGDTGPRDAGPRSTDAADCTPEAETCNGLDDDCDGLIDEDVASEALCRTGAAGSCEGRARCVAGKPACVALTPRPEICDGVDDDCDGTIDEGATEDEACDLPSGVCGTGRLRCRAGEEACVAIMREEACDGVDDDCDGNVDEGLGGEPCRAEGACGITEGVRACSAGRMVCDLPSASETCNDVDDDCDGHVDEDAADCEPCEQMERALVCAKERTWVEAAAFCEQQARALARVDDEAEQMYFAERANRQDPERRAQYWIGLRSVMDTGPPPLRFRWLPDEAGSPAPEYENWARGEPNMLRGSNCARMRDGDRRWADRSCDDSGIRYRFLCE